VDAEVDLHARVGGGIVVLGDVLQNLNVVMEGFLLLVQLGERQGYGIGIILDLSPEAGFSLANEMAVMGALDAAFEAQSNEETYGDGEEMEKEVADTVHLSVRRVDVEHRQTSCVALEDNVTEGVCGIPSLDR